MRPFEPWVCGKNTTPEFTKFNVDALHVAYDVLSEPIFNCLRRLSEHMIVSDKQFNAISFGFLNKLLASIQRRRRKKVFR